MNIIKTDLPDVLIIEPKVFGDARGFFYESFNACTFAEATGLRVTFVQDNHSRSAKNVLRGLHYQIKQPQGKLVRVVAGEVFDVAVDLRKNSPTFGKWEAFELSEENGDALYVPEGIAHGFYTLSNDVRMLYSMSVPYSAAHASGIHWNDPDTAIPWPGLPSLISAKDVSWPKLRTK